MGYAELGLRAANPPPRPQPRRTENEGNMISVLETGKATSCHELK